jgi:hypothetical protein
MVTHTCAVRAREGRKRQWKDLARQSVGCTAFFSTRLGC